MSRDVIGSVGMRRLNTMVSSLVLRRTKKEMCERQQLALPEREVRTHRVQMSQEESNIHQVLFMEAQ